MIRLSLVLAVALVGCSPSATRSTPPASPAPMALAGPYPSIEAYCAARATVADPDLAPPRCGRGTLLHPPEAQAAGPIRAAALIERRATPEGDLDALAIQTDQGWFVDENDAYSVQYDGPHRVHLLVDSLTIEAARVHLGARLHAYTSATAGTTAMAPTVIQCDLVAGRPRCAREGAGK